MSDTDGKKPLGLGGPRSGQVKQSFSHGRTKNVVVETKRKRVVVPKPGTAGAPGAAGTASHLGDPSKRPAGISDAEMERRLSALRNAKAREAGEALQRAADEVAREEERQRRRDEIEAKEREERERAAAQRQKVEEEERAKALAEVKASRAEDAKKPQVTSKFCQAGPQPAQDRPGARRA
jgi:translation initiation factor IF-2